MNIHQKLSHFSSKAQKEIALQTLAAKQGFELIFSNGKIYCSTEFHYKTFSSFEEAEKFILGEWVKRTQILTL